MAHGGIANKVSVEEVYRQAVTSKNPQAILEVARAFRDLGESEKAVWLEGRAFCLDKFTCAFGADTSVIQARLNALGANPQLTVDGISGPNTIAAIKAFQSSHDITPDGVVGPITLTALGMSGSETAPTAKPSAGSSIIAVRGLETKSDAFKNKLVEVSNALGINPDWLATVISFESKGTFAPNVQNPQSKATGLIQFIKPTATQLGTTLENLAAMTDIQQLNYVYRYFKDIVGRRMRNLDDVYLAVFMPSQMGKSSNSVVATQGSKVYEQNPFDRDGKGYFTVGDITSTIHAVYNAGAARGRVPVGVAIAGGGGLALAGIGLGAWYLWKKRKARA